MITNENIVVRLSAASDLKRVLMDAGHTTLSEQELVAMLHIDINTHGRAKLKVLKDGKTAFAPVGERVARTLALYAVLAMNDDHEWAVVNVVEEEAMKTLAATGSLPDRMAEDLTKLAASVATAPGPVPQMVRKEYDDSPVLVRWVSKPEGPPDADGTTAEVWSEERLTHKTLQAKVGQLVMAGVDPEKIEIWTGLRRPKVSIVLE